MRKQKPLYNPGHHVETIAIRIATCDCYPKTTIATDRKRGR
ncbi:hypothetical protein [Sorlinia euscelidii]